MLGGQPLTDMVSSKQTRWARLWIRRVLVRSQEGQLESRRRVLAAFVCLPLGLLVVVASLKEIEAVVPHQVDDPMLGGETAAPHVGPQVFQRLRLADAGEGIAHDGFHDLEGPSGGFRIGLDPPGKILAELVLEDGDAPLPT